MSTLIIEATQKNTFLQSRGVNYYRKFYITKKGKYCFFLYSQMNLNFSQYFLELINENNNKGN